MIADLNYWIILAVACGLTFVVPPRFRFHFFSIYSLIVLFYLVNSITNGLSEAENHIFGFNFFEQRFWFIYQLLGISLATFYLPNLFASEARSKFFVRTALIITLLLYLAYHKYIPSLLLYVSGKALDIDLLIPLGISYFTFKLIHYLIEHGRDKFNEHTIFQFLTYIFLFPIYTAGPIERFDHFQQHWNSQNRREDIIEGLTRISYGLIKKFFVAGVILSSVISHHDTESALIRLDALAFYEVWAFVIVSYLLIYMDFSSYSDIAIGSSRILGFRIMENFNWPILATNITLLWKRWHMTLTSWCQAYVYMPTIGLSRNPYLAIILTFLAVGLWHGGAITWVAWGLYQGIGVCGYVIWTRIKRKRKITIPTNFVTNTVAVLITNIWMAGSFIFTITYTDGSFSDLESAFLLFAKCLLII